MNNLKNDFYTTILPKIQKELGITNRMAVPRLSKIVVSMGLSDALSDKKNLERGQKVLSQVTGQKPRITKAKKAIAAFKLRIGDEIGVMVTLRGKRMYHFFEKLVAIVLPRVRDFHGVSLTSFDGKGNYSLGFAESTVFPEIDPGKVEKAQGVEITIVTTAKDNKNGMALLKAFGMPFKK
ncbi:MAG: 50S ribosomal protein L5 [Candidatus Levybacteria bacterium RIFCSPHIGHO2_02_FULL_42_12]|nr:MAG: 50S ribosomal protein L5 [Candidatus Levybacteria bacterium RIFCSPHIGHO2_01_FULL_42_15]OGH31423.1 MAG: 50S ribosomal protein L5 [Candidatus Levybacteria bacterium RIFCSPHIGHO2_02_FULL_42_12]OGH42687.1 MAG: 50S ribosomal protein L5 [Candidatus Levybacteria bacterium RIFCSPLOWO2_01_FULL_42_15]